MVAMDDLRKILPARLSELFKGETQESVARKLNTQQGNVSKWVNGTNIPPTETLLFISKAYKVSAS